ncbi:MAG TPA: AAA family ATPase [Patescibacteria group bacterium]|nr:AAA family ATPase [Patescibacteria group bacterium]
MATRSSPITVGRDRELARIDEAREQAAEGRAAIVIVRGEAGIGKTRLVEDAIGRARASGSPILHGACLDLQGEGLPYLPFVEALRNFARTTPRDRTLELLGPAVVDLGRIVPEIAALVDDPGMDASAEPPQTTVDRARLFERVLGFIDRLGAEQPVLALVEDVQWVDPATHDLITFLIRNVTRERLVAILTCRTDDLAPGHPVLGWLAELGRAPGAIRIDLGRLTRRDVERQLRAMHGGPVEEEVVRSIWERSEGHPLFAEELLAAAGDPDRPAQPALVEVLLTRVAALDVAARPIVRALAVAGGPVDELLLGPMLERSAAEVGAALREGTAGGVLAVRPDGRYGFRHELLREIVERELSPGERRDLHERFARALEATPGLADERPAAATAELARHWAAANRPIEAHRAALAAAAAAVAVHAFADAHRQFERAFALEPSLPPDALPSLIDRIDARRRAATAADLGGSPDRAGELIRAALTAAEEHGDPVVSGILHSRLAFLTWALGDGEAALVEHRRAVGLVPAEPPSTARAAVLGGLGGALMGLGRWAESRPICEAAIACALGTGSTREESRARMNLGSALVALGDVDAGIHELRRAHDLAGQDPSELRVVIGHNLGLNLLGADRLDEALAVAQAARVGARAGGLERRYGMELAALAADVLVRLGRWDEAEEVTAEGLALDQRGTGTPYLAAVLARLLARRGQVAEAGRRLARIDGSRLEADLAVLHAIVAAEIAIAEGRPELALEAVTAVIDPWLATGDVLWGVPLVTFGLRAAAEQAEALRVAHDAAALADLDADVGSLRDHAMSLGGRVVSPGAAAWLTTAEAERSRHDGVLDPEPWRRAIAAWDLAIDPYEAAYARYRFAETELRRAGVKAAVATELVAAWRSTVALGAVSLQAAIETLARRARVPLTADPQHLAAGTFGEVGAGDAPAPPVTARSGRSVADSGIGRGHGLSPREVEVLRLVAAGRSNGEIGEELFITRKTAGVHVTHILDKLGVSNRVEAAMAAARLGLLEGDAGPAPGPRASRVSPGVVVKGEGQSPGSMTVLTDSE